MARGVVGWRPKDDCHTCSIFVLPLAAPAWRGAVEGERSECGRASRQVGQLHSEVAALRWARSTGGRTTTTSARRSTDCSPLPCRQTTPTTAGNSRCLVQRARTCLSSAAIRSISARAGTGVSHCSRACCCTPSYASSPNPMDPSEFSEPHGSPQRLRDMIVNDLTGIIEDHGTYWNGELLWRGSCPAVASGSRGNASYDHTFHGALPVLQCCSRTSRSRGVSIGCQKPSCS
jgi:hypothetical protein